MPSIVPSILRSHSHCNNVALLNTVSEQRADLAVIQECEDPAMVQDEAYREWATGHAWVGARKSKGLGVFPRPRLRVNPVELQLGLLEFFALPRE